MVKPPEDSRVFRAAGWMLYADVSSGFAMWRARRMDPCVCRHPEWVHQGLLEPACGWLGGCGCGLFVKSLTASLP